MSADARGLCGYARTAGHFRDVRDRPRPEPEALVVHTTGRGVYAQAKRLQKSVIDTVLGEYLDPEANFAHYVIDLDGQLWQIANETESAWHCRVTPQEAAAYAEGTWRVGAAPAGLAAWDRAFGSGAHPGSLLLTGAPNQVAIGAELIPLPTPDGAGSLYTAAQYAAVARLRDDIAARWRLPSVPLFGHEDLSPLTRWDRRGGWDPGARRDRPWFSWGRVDAP